MLFLCLSHKRKHHTFTFNGKWQYSSHSLDFNYVRFYIGCIWLCFLFFSPLFSLSFHPTLSLSIFFFSRCVLFSFFFHFRFVVFGKIVIWYRAKVHAFGWFFVDHIRNFCFACASLHTLLSNFIAFWRCVFQIMNKWHTHITKRARELRRKEGKTKQSIQRQNMKYFNSKTYKHTKQQTETGREREHTNSREKKI